MKTNISLRLETMKSIFQQSVDKITQQIDKIKTESDFELWLRYAENETIKQLEEDKARLESEIESLRQLIKEGKKGRNSSS